MGRTDTGGWHVARRVLPDLWVLAEPGHVCSWLLIGDARAALIDTGMGFTPLRPCVEQLTDLPVVVATTHHHFDHIGSHHEFDAVAATPETSRLLSRPTPPEVLEAYARQARENYLVRSRQPPAAAALCAPEFSARPMPPSVDDGSWSIGARTVDTVLGNGETIELGGRRLTVIATPGHSADGISLLDSRAGYLFAGDTVNRGLLYAHLPDADLNAYIDTIGRLRAVRGCRAICCAHWPWPIADLAILDEIRAALSALLRDRVELEPTLDVIGQHCLVARFERCAVTVPDPRRPAKALHDAR